MWPVVSLWVPWLTPTDLHTAEWSVSIMRLSYATPINWYSSENSLPQGTDWVRWMQKKTQERAVRRTQNKYLFTCHSPLLIMCSHFYEKGLRGTSPSMSQGDYWLRELRRWLRKKSPWISLADMRPLSLDISDKVPERCYGKPMRNKIIVKVSRST